MEFLKKHWKWILLAVIVIIAIALYVKKKKESDYEGWAADIDKSFDPKEWSEVPGACVDCGPGGMFGPGWTMEKFEKRIDELKKRAYELGGGLSGAELEQAIKRAGGLIPYIDGREIAVKRMEGATNNLKDAMNIPGVHGLGSMMGEYIEIAVIDEATKQKVIKFIEEKKKAMPMIPGHGEGKYMGYPVKIVIREQAVAQK
jgi:hypothetical protein